MVHHALLAPVVLAATVAAQSLYVPDANPGAGDCNVVPFGTNTRSATYSNQLYQQMVTVADFGTLTTATICDLGWSSCVAGIRHFDKIEIRLGQTKAATLSPTFAANLVTNVQTVLRAEEHDWHHGADRWARIGLDRSYTWRRDRGNLVVEVRIEGSVLDTGSSAFPGMRRGTRQRVYTLGWTRNPPQVGVADARALKIELAAGADVSVFGLGCRGTNGTPDLTLSGTGRLGAGLAVDLADAPGAAAVLLSIGFERREVPVDLRLIGARGCLVYHPDHILLPGRADGGGRARVTAAVPNDLRLLCARVYFQWFPLDPGANTLGVTASNYGRVLIGP